MQIELWQALTLTGVGVIAGFLNVMAGGGSLITMPVMIFMGLPGPVANGTNRIAILAQNLSAITAFFRRGFAELRLSISLAACAIPGAIVGAMLGVNLEGEWFNRLLAMVMVAVMLIMHFDRNRGPGDPGSEPTRQQMVRGHLLMVVVGFWGGFIQVGVGFIIMPVLNRVMGLDLVRTNMHKVFIIAVYTTVALAVFASQVELLWVFGAALALGNSIGGYLGAHFAVSKGERLIKWILNLLLIVFIAKLLFFP